HHRSPPSFPTRRSSDLLRARMHVQFLVDGSQVRAQGVHADAERPGDVLLQPALREQSKYLVFALAQILHAIRRFRNRLEMADDRSEEHTSELQSLRHLV